MKPEPPQIAALSAMITRDLEAIGRLEAELTPLESALNVPLGSAADVPTGCATSSRPHTGERVSPDLR